MLRVLPLKGSTDTSFSLFAAEANRAWEARGISFAIFIGIILFMWLPMWLFKVSVRRLVTTAHRVIAECLYAG